MLKQKGVNILTLKIPFPALAERDNADIRFGLEQGINFIAISFVRTAKDVQEVRAICEETGNGHVKLLAKIENQQGIDNIDEIIDAADGITIAVRHGYRSTIRNGSSLPKNDYH